MSAPSISSAWPTTSEQEAYWQNIRRQFMLDPEEIYLNTGSFGSQPRPVFDSLVKGIETIERSPTANRGPLYEQTEEARRRLGAFVHAPAEDLAFTTNVTVSINMVVHGLDWNPGDEILASNQEYGAIDNCLHHAERRWGVRVNRAEIPIPPPGPEAIVNAFEAGITDRTRLLVCSHIATRTGLIAPIQALAKLAHAHNALIAVDGAHAPGMIPLDLPALECDFYGGNCHKWLCAPKGTGLLYVRPEVQDRLHHIVVSWGYDREGVTRDENGRLQIKGKPFMWGLENWGTRDLAALAAVGAAVDFQEAIGQGRILARGRQLAGYLRERMSELGWARLLTPTAPGMSGSISAFRLTGFGDMNLYQALNQRYRITTPASKDGEGHWIRVSTHICNGFDHVDRLVEALIELRKEAAG